MLGQAFGTPRFRDIEDSLFSHTGVWLIISGVAMIAYAVIPPDQTLSVFNVSYRVPKYCNLMTGPALCGSLALLWLSFFHTHLNVPLRAFSFASRASYKLYVFHFVLLMWIQYFLISYTISVYAKLLISVGGTIAFVYVVHALAEYLLRRNATPSP
jgi:cellulose synthase/poly-beta-1,6-N-acetylglucosamine synthase-like glycosyltransferase